MMVDVMLYSGEFVRLKAAASEFITITKNIVENDA